MNIAVITPYGNVYNNDKLFDLSACKIGQNLLLPEILLKENLEKQDMHIILRIGTILRKLIYLFLRI